MASSPIAPPALASRDPTIVPKSRAYRLEYGRGVGATNGAIWFEKGQCCF
jgi:hypothetical protein